MYVCMYVCTCMYVCKYVYVCMYAATITSSAATITTSSVQAFLQKVLHPNASAQKARGDSGKVGE